MLICAFATTYYYYYFFVNFYLYIFFLRYLCAFFLSQFDFTGSCITVNRYSWKFARQWPRQSILCTLTVDTVRTGDRRLRRYCPHLSTCVRRLPRGSSSPRWSANNSKQKKKNFFYTLISHKTYYNTKSFLNFLFSKRSPDSFLYVWEFIYSHIIECGVRLVQKHYQYISMFGLNLKPRELKLYKKKKPEEKIVVHPRTTEQ